jgi:hypothetical protein
MGQLRLRGWAEWGSNLTVMHDHGGVWIGVARVFFVFGIRTDDLHRRIRVLID